MTDPTGTELTLTEREAVDRALSRQAVTDSWEATIAEDEAQALTVGAWPNPHLGYSREQSFEDPQTVAEDFVVLEQTLPLSGQRGLLADAARKRAEATRLETRADAVRLTSQVRRVFYRVLLLQNRVEARAEWIDKVSDLEEDLRERVQAGESAPYELERLRKELADITASLQVDRGELARQQAELAGLIGEAPATTPLHVSGELLPAAMPSDEAQQESIEQRPQLVAAQRRVEAARLRDTAASRWWVPEPALTGGYKGASIGDERFHGFVAGLSLALPVFDRNQGQRLAAEAAVVRAQSRKELLERRLSAEVSGLTLQVRRLQVATQTYRTEGVERAERVLVMGRQAYDAGEVGILELIDAYRGTVDARLRALELASETRRRHIELLQNLEQPEVTVPSNEGE
jgi:cobalt-zinc-cadmium efflux system outer membrane protein